MRSQPSATAVALNANDPPGVDGEDVRDSDGCALDTAFPGRDAAALADLPDFNYATSPTDRSASASTSSGLMVTP